LGINKKLQLLSVFAIKKLLQGKLLDMFQ